MKAVLDTNIFISAAISKTGKPSQIIDLARAGKFGLVTSEEILTELKRAIHYNRIKKQYGLQEQSIQKFLRQLKRVSSVVKPKIKVKVVKNDPDDDKFLACAREGKAKYVVTGDPHLLKLGRYQEIKMIKPAEFLKLIQKQAIKRSRVT